MKTVWVNRHNADGSVKPMSEWKLRVCENFQNFYYTVDDVVIFCRKDERRWTQEELRIGDLSNQRGDGWFYVEDGDLPPHSYSENILAHTSTGEYAIIVSWLYNSRTVEVIYGKPICWQPIQQPKFIGECDV